MRANGLHAVILGVCLSAGVGVTLIAPGVARAQESSKPDAASSPAAKSADDVRALADSIHDLQSEVEQLRAQMSELRADERHAREEAQELQRELAAARSQAASSNGSAYASAAPSGAAQPTATASAPAPSSSPAPTSGPYGGASPQYQTAAVPPDDGDRSEETHGLIEGKLRDLYQTKVETASKYRVRLTGIVLVNLFSNRGAVDNLDFPSTAADPDSLGSGGTFGGSLRQSQIGLQVFGPDIAGAHTSADVMFDFAAGVPDTPYGSTTGIVRMRTGTVRFDWANTSIIAG